MFISERYFKLHKLPHHSLHSSYLKPYYTTREWASEADKLNVTIKNELPVQYRKYTHVSYSFLRYFAINGSVSFAVISLLLTRTILLLSCYSQHTKMAFILLSQLFEMEERRPEKGLPEWFLKSSNVWSWSWPKLSGKFSHYKCYRYMLTTRWQKWLF